MQTEESGRSFRDRPASLARLSKLGRHPPRGAPTPRGSTPLAGDGPGEFPTGGEAARRISRPISTPNRPADDALAFYHLDEAPFTLDPDPRFAYHSAAYDRVAQQMLAAIGAREPLVVLTGECGAGKTTLCHALADQLDRRTLTSFVAAPCQSIEELLELMLVDFGVVSRPHTDTRMLTRADLNAVFHDFLASLIPLHAFAIVMIDEAQDVAAEALREIAALVDPVDHTHLLQVILVGRPPLQSMLNRPALKALAKKTTVRCVLGPLGADEVPAYVSHRLQVAALRPGVSFDAAALDRVFELSQGVPAVVNVLCDRAIAGGSRARARVIHESLVRRAADELDLAPLPRGWARAQVARIAVGLALLAMAGAAAAALIFRAQVEALMGR